MIGITGAAGQLGRAVLSAIAQLRPDAGCGVVACTSQPDKLDIPANWAAEKRAADFRRPETLVSAFTDIDTLLVISAEGPDEERIEMHRNALRAALKAGVRRIVYTSFFDVDPASPSSVARVHRLMEEDIMTSPIKWVMLRNGPYLENSASRAAAAAGDDGIFRWSCGDAKLPFICREDLALSAAKAVVTDVENVAFRLSGPELLSFAELCALVSGALGKPLRFLAISDEEFAQDLRRHGMDELLIARRIAYAQAMRLGFMTGLTDDFHKLTGRDPQHPADVLRSIELAAPVH